MKCLNPNPHAKLRKSTQTHFPSLTATLGGGGKYIPVDPAPVPLGPALLKPAAISSSTFLSALSNPGLNGLPGNVGLLSPNLVESFGLLRAGPPLVVSFEEALLEEPKWFLSGRSLVPPKRLNASVLGVCGLRADAEAPDGKLALLAAGEEGLLENSLRDMAGSLDSTMGDSRCA